MIIRVPEELDGMRVDAALAALVSDRSRSFLQKLLEDGSVSLSGRSVRKSGRVHGGDELDVLIPETVEYTAIAQDLPLDVRFEDDDVIVVNKARGMVVHPAPGHWDGTLVNALLFHCGDSLSGIGGVTRPGIVHRIDRDTSGLIIAAKNDDAHMSLSSQLKDHSLSRTYEAVIHGSLSEDSGTVDAPIGRHPTDRKRMCVRRDNSRDAVTHWRVLERFTGYTHIQCALETGRTHQIRVHMAHIGHPILGDMVYGRARPELGLTGQCLHARELRFTHPRTGERITVTTELPDYFVEVLDKLKRLG